MFDDAIIKSQSNRLSRAYNFNGEFTTVYNVNIK